MLELPVWWPVAALSYCASLVSVPTAVFVYWWWLKPEEAALGFMLELYLAATAVGLVFAMVLSVLVERPFMRLRALLGNDSASWSFGTAVRAADTAVDKNGASAADEGDASRLARGAPRAPSRPRKPEARKRRRGRFSTGKPTWKPYGFR